MEYTREPVTPVPIEVAVTVKVDVPVPVGTPLMTPVDALRVRPAGSAPLRVKW
jgi:hypothetical protein